MKWAALEKGKGTFQIVGQILREIPNKKEGEKHAGEKSESKKKKWPRKKTQRWGRQSYLYASEGIIITRGRGGPWTITGKTGDSLKRGDGKVEVLR